jgi:hypothetical protein
MKLLDWMDKHKLFTVIFSVWLAWLMTTVTLIGFLNPPEMNGSVATVLVTIWGVPALIAGLIKWRGEIISKKGSE